MRKLYARLKSDGFAPWLDEKDLLPGQNWREEIPAAVRASDVVIVCLSRSSINKEGYLQREIREALSVEEEKPEGTIFIIPARIEEVAVPQRLSKWHWANLFSEDGYPALIAALDRRARALGVSTTSANNTSKQETSPPESAREKPAGTNPPADPTFPRRDQKARQSPGAGQQPKTTGTRSLDPSLEPRRPQELVRELNGWHATAIVAGTIIGSGIFLVPHDMMQAVGSASLVYVAWAVGGLLSFFGALTYAELGAVRPFAGGEYVYVRDGWGPLAGFLYAWTWFLIAKPGSIATITRGLVLVLGRFNSFGFLSQALVQWHITQQRVFALTYGDLVAILATILITGLNYVGVRKAGNFQLILTALKVALIIGIAFVGFTASSGSWSNFGTQFLGSKGGMAGFMAALVAALWAYDGWNDLNMVSGEIRNPGRNIPIALIAGVALVAVLYMGMNAAIQYTMPAAAIAQTNVPASTATQIAIGGLGTALVLVGMAVSLLVTLNGTILSGGRIPFAVARDGYFFSRLAEVHPRFHTPALALIVQAIVAIVLLLIGGAFRELFSLTIFAEWLFYMVAASTIFIFRWREPDVPRPYRTWGYPVVPALFILAAAVLLYFTFAENLKNSIVGTAVILAGIPVFFYFARSKTPTTQQMKNN